MLLHAEEGDPSHTYRTPDGGETRKEVGEFFAAIPRADDIHAFEARAFIEADEHVTVLGWESSTARETKKTFESEWVRVFTVREGKNHSLGGFFNTAARYGM